MFMLLMGKQRGFSQFVNPGLFGFYLNDLLLEIFFKIILFSFIFGCAASSSLCTAPSSCGKQRLLSSCGV